MVTWVPLVVHPSMMICSTLSKVWLMTLRIVFPRNFSPLMTNVSTMIRALVSGVWDAVRGYGSSKWIALLCPQLPLFVFAMTDTSEIIPPTLQQSWMRRTPSSCRFSPSGRNNTVSNLSLSLLACSTRPDFISGRL